MNAKMMTLAFMALIGMAAGGSAFADPGQTRLTDFVDMRNLLADPGPGPLRATSPMIASLQDEGWGWGEEPKKEDGKKEGKKEEAKKEEPKKEGEESGGGWGEEPSKKEEKKPAKKEEPKSEKSESSGWGDEGKGDKGKESGDWGSGWDEGGGQPETEPGTGPVEEGEEPVEEGTSPNQARKLRIGLEAGGFVPLGAKEEEYATGQFGGLFLGFGLPPLLGDLTITSELRLIGGRTTSTDQVKGFDMSTTLVGIRDDFLVHFLPRNKTLNLFLFVGVGLAAEMSTGEGVDPVLGSTLNEKATYVGFLADAGLGAWITVVSSVDLFLRLEIDFIPMTNNVPFFMVGEAGLQVRF